MVLVEPKIDARDRNTEGLRGREERRNRKYRNIVTHEILFLKSPLQNFNDILKAVCLFYDYDNLFKLFRPG